MLTLDNCIMVDDHAVEPVWMGRAHMAGRRKGDKRDPDEITKPIVKPIPIDDAPEESSDEVWQRRADENTKDLIWEYMRDMVRETRRGNAQVVLAIKQSNETIERLRKTQDEEDQRHVQAAIDQAKLWAEGMKAQAAAEEAKAEKALAARKYEAKLGAGLALFLILVIVVLAGFRVSGNILGNQFEASQTTKP